ncbi:MAG: hypothetical protein DHS20C17_18700 [Cyclobacteriaceae bacterium]|nr:MAG: hypothetical protein DHS20C17_18700 [Cyclobacteriaceae bacterium]
MNKKKKPSIFVVLNSIYQWNKLNMKKSILASFFSINITNDQCKDTGMAMVLILLIIGFFTNNILYYQLAIPVLLLDMISPRLFYPIAIVWLGLSNLLGFIMSKIILTLIFVVFVVPVALVRRILGKDPLQLKNWKKTTKSVMMKRDHLYVPEDIKKPY